MSAFLVDPEHIHVMLWAANRPVGYLGPLRWYFDNPSRSNQLDGDNLDQVGQMLADENSASVNFRYSQD